MIMTVAFIGLGEVGSNVTIGLAKKGVSVKGYDIKFETEGREAFKKCADAGVQMGIVVGGGNFWRGRSSGAMDRTVQTISECLRPQ